VLAKATDDLVSLRFALFCWSRHRHRRAFRHVEHRLHLIGMQFVLAQTLAMMSPSQQFRHQQCTDLS